MVLDSLPDQCAKDHTSTEMLVSHATYDQPKVLDFRVVQMWRRPMQLPAKKTPTMFTAPRRNPWELPRPVQTHTTRRMLLWVHLPIQLHAAWPVPFRLAFHCPGLVRDIPEHWNQPNKKEPPPPQAPLTDEPLMGCCVSFYQTMGMHGWVVYRTAA